MIVLTKKDFWCVDGIYLCIFLHELFAKSLGIFSILPCNVCKLLSRKLDEISFKTKVIELAEKKGVIPFPFARGFHPQLTLFREISSMQVRSSIQTTSAHL
jgi:hypothetical protein